MKIAYAEPLPKPFRPVTITLETLEELRTLRAVGDWCTSIADLIVHHGGSYGYPTREHMSNVLYELASKLNSPR